MVVRQRPAPQRVRGRDSRTSIRPGPEGENRMADISQTEIDKLRNALDEAVTYPLLTKGVNGHVSHNGHVPGGYDGSPLARTAQGAIRDLLGWRYRTDDPKGFLAALKKAVDLTQVEGHLESSWKARPYTVQADLG